MVEAQEDYHFIGRLLFRASRLLSNMVTEEFSDFKIGKGQVFSLLAIYDNEGLCQKDICEDYNLDKAAVGRSLKKLESKNFIKRVTDPDDKRRKRVFLAEKGKNFRPECMRRLRNIENNIRGALGREETENFKIAIKKICDSLEGCSAGGIRETTGKERN